jgi:hypothetical protein
MPSRKKREGRERRLRKFMRKMPDTEVAPPPSAEEVQKRLDAEKAVEERFNVPGLAADMAELRRLQDRIRDTIRGATDATDATDAQ